ncbi:MAG: insulinase family protein [Phycisphaerales bacterium]|nr:insulinase family protein [Phycisphaerales bacterium]
MNTMITAACIAGTVLGGAMASAQDIPSHPREIEFEALEFMPPEADEFRHELSNGVPVYMAPSNEFPLVDIRFSFKGGGYLEPDDKAGLSAMTGQMIRTGGSSMMAPSELDEEFDFLASNVTVGVGATSANARVNTLTSNLHRTFELFMDMLRNPRFDDGRLETLRGQALEGLKARDDNGLAIALREFSYLMWGEDHHESRQPTRESLESITTDDLRSFHEKIFHPGNLMIAVTGDFEEQEMLAFLEEQLSGWEVRPEAPDAPAPTHLYKPGVYYYEKEQPQVQVLVGHRSITRDDPNAIEAEIMNQILGGSGFTSRITNSVRTREGLAYTAGSFMQPRVDYPGIFASYFFTKTPTTALATRLVFDEFERIQNEPVTTDELETIQNNLIETFPRNFESKDAMLGIFMNDERTDRPEGYWQSYRDRVRAVTPEMVQKAANEYLHPEDAVILVVGPWEEIRKGNADSEADPNRVATMEEFFSGQATKIPTRDPESLMPIED